MNKKPSLENSLSSIFLFTASRFFMAILIIFVRYLSNLEFHTFQIILVRYSIAALLFLPFFSFLHTRNKKSLSELVKTKRLPLHFIRGVFGFLGMACWFYVLTTLKLPDAVALSFLLPFFITIAAKYFLKEKISFSVWLTILVGFSGALIIIKPNFHSLDIEYFLVLLTICCWTFNDIITKKLTSTESPQTITFYMSLGIALVSLPFAIPVLQGLSIYEIVLFIVFALCSNIAYNLMNTAYKKSPISLVQPFEFTKLVFVSILSFIFFKEVTDFWTIVGVIIIISSSQILFLVRKNEEKLLKAMKLAEEQQEKARKAEEEAEELLQSRMVFFSNMNHELKTPLISILGHAQEIISQNKKQQDQNYKNALEVQFAGEHLTTLLDNILDVSKIRKGELLLHEEEFFVGETLESCAKIMRIRSERIGLKLNFKNLLSSDIKIYMDKAKLKQVVLNVLTNSVRFTKKGSVTVTLDLDKDKNILIKAKDTGCGIGAKELKKNLKRYKELNTNIKRGDTVGLGLPLNKKLIELHDGEIIINSQLNKGTETIIKLPSKRLVRAEEKKVTKAKKVKKVDPSKKFADKTFLSVDDNVINMHVLGKLLKIKMAAILEKENDGRKVFEVIERYKPDLIFMDENLGMDKTGSEIIKELKTNKKYAEYKKIPVIMLTADTDKKDVDKLMKISNAEGYTSKPIDIDKLAELIEKLVK